MNRALPSLLLLLAPFAAAQAPRPLPPLDTATLAYDTKAGAAIGWPALLETLSKLDVVFLGETHIDDTTHRVELAVLEGLLAARQGKVVLSMEMFERDVQGVLDQYLAGAIDEATFVQKARAWENYPTAYRPLIEAAKAAKIPVVAANFPGTLRRRLAQGGKAAIDALPPAQRALVPAEIFPASEAYWERVARAVRGHMGMGMGGGTPEEKLYDPQNLWDNAMGDNIARARAEHPDRVVLHVAGGFHVAYRDGTVAQFVRRSEGSKFAVVQIEPVTRAHDARPERDREEADFVVYAEAHARDFNEGNYAVSVPAELRYRLEVPAGGSGLPLFVWLPDRSTRVDDAMAFWLHSLGDGAAVAVVEPPFPDVADDLATGGRYVSGDGFRSDYDRLQTGVARIVEYVTRRFPVDGQKVVIAGAGDGGAAVLWTALYGEWLAADMLAIDPNDLTRLSMEALPNQAPATRSLQLLAQRVELPKLEKVAADYTKVGTPTTVASLGNGADELVELVRAKLALGKRTDCAAPQGPTYLTLAQDLPRARQWAELYAARLRLQGIPTRLVTAAELPADAAKEQVRHLAVGGDGHWSVASFASGEGLPLAGGPFGGTTVVVLPKGTPEAERAAWLAHEQKKVVKKRSMFANIAIACADGEPTLGQVMADLKKRGRSRVLVVPAVFCADAALMRSLKDGLGDAAAGMDLAWLPGLGAELVTGER